MPRRIDPGDLAAVLPAHGLTLVSACSAESALLADAVEAAGGALGPMSFCGVFVGGLNRRTWRAGPASRVLTFFQTPELSREPERVDFLPLCYQDILALLRTRRRPDALLFMCAPPDEQGWCSFGTEVAFGAALWPDIPVRIAHINPAMPRTSGDRGIPFDQITGFMEADQPLLNTPSSGNEPASAAIAGHVSGFIGDGATLQAGLGRIPDAVLRRLADRRDLRAHTGLMGEGLLALVEAGAIERPGGATVGVAIGSERLYAALDHPAFQFQPPTVTHDPAQLAALNNLVTLNSALEVDLFGQAYAELTPGGLMSGPGGASDFARGARGHGLRIVALPATAGRERVSRIVAPGQGRGPVSLGRMDIDIVVTEHGAADLRLLDHAARARALLDISAPEQREPLERAWTDYAKSL